MEPWVYLVFFVALALGGLAKGATGMGLPVIVLPVLTTVISLPHAIALMIVPILFSNVWQAWQLRAARGAEALRFLPPFLVTVVFGVAAGAWLLKTLPERILIFALGLLLIVYVGMRLLQPSIRIGAALARRVAIPVGFGAGVFSGAIGLSTPIGVTFIHWMGLARDTHVFAVSVMFVVMGGAQLPAMTAVGLMQPLWILEGVLALVPVLLFMPAGVFLARRLSQAAFDRIILAFLGLIGLKMLLGV